MRLIDGCTLDEINRWLNKEDPVCSLESCVLQRLFVGTHLKFLCCTVLFRIFKQKHIVEMKLKPNIIYNIAPIGPTAYCELTSRYY